MHYVQLCQMEGAQTAVLLAQRADRLWNHTCHVKGVEGHLGGRLPHTLGSNDPHSLPGGCQASHVLELHQPLEAFLRSGVQWGV